MARFRARSDPRTRAGSGDGKSRGRDRAGQGGQGRERPPVRTQQGRGHHRPSRRHLPERPSALAPVLRECVRRRRLHARRRLLALRQPLQHRRPARQHHVLRLQAGRSRVPCAAAVQPARRSCRSSAAGARRRRSASTGSARRRHRRTIAPTTASRQPYVVRDARGLADPPAVRVCAAASRSRSGTRGRRRQRARRSRRSTRRRRCPVSGPRRPTCTRRASAGSTGAPSAGYARRGGFYGVTVHDFADTTAPTASTGWTTTPFSTFPLLRDAWVLSLHGRVETTYTGDDEQIPFFMLPALGGGSTPARLRELAIPRPHTACCCRPSGACWPTASSTWRCSTTPARSRRAPADLSLRRTEERLRPRLPAARTARRRRCASSWRRATRASRWCSRRRPRSEEPIMRTLHTARRS